MFKQRRSLPGGTLEYAVLDALWNLGSGSARDVYNRVGRPSGRVYTTISKVLDRLHAKGLVSRERHGRAFTYRPAASRTIVEHAQAKRTLRGMFGATSRPAIATLVDAVESIDPALLDELARAVAARRRSRRGS